MKKIVIIISFIFLLGSCLKEPDFHSYQVNITIDFGSEFPSGKKAGAKVTLSNQLKNYTLTTNTNSDGVVQFDFVEPGFYTVTVSHSSQVSGNVSYFNGTKKLEVFGNTNSSVKVSIAPSNDFVIKEFYYSGSTTLAGRPYSADQYIEIYNNSPVVQYADGISVLEHDSYGTGENYWAIIKDTVVLRMLWTIPGNGTQVPVLPGRSIVLARTGIDHRDDPNGNPLSPVNMGHADFEFYVFNQPEKDIDSPTVPNLEEDNFVFRGSDVTFNVKGGSAIAIAKLPCSTPEERMEYIRKNIISKNSVSGSKTNDYPKVADKYIIDAIEVVFDEAHAIYKRFTPDLDMGYTYVNAGSGSGKCIRRKIREIIDDRVVYQDTNNSSEDFLKDVDPKPKIYE